MTAPLSHLELFLWLAACLGFVFLSGLFSGSETGLYCINQTKLHLAAHRKDASALRLRRLLEDRTGLLFTTLFGTNLANYLAPLCLTVVFLRSITAESQAEVEHLAELYTTLILTPFVFIFGEIVPKNLFQRNADHLMRHVSRILRTTHRAFAMTGIIWIQRKCSEFVISRFGRQTVSGMALHSRVDVYQMLREGAAEGALTLTQSSILERIHLVRSITVGRIMVHRSRVVMIPDDAKRADVERILRRTPYSRLPVYRENRRRISGVVHLLDILTAPPDRPVGAAAKQPVEIPPDMSVVDALSILQRGSRRLAVVTSPNGQCLGIVTVKDLVEEIVGELAAW